MVPQRDQYFVPPQGSAWERETLIAEIELGTATLAFAQQARGIRSRMLVRCISLRKMDATARAIDHAITTPGHATYTRRSSAYIQPVVDKNCNEWYLMVSLCSSLELLTLCYKMYRES